MPKFEIKNRWLVVIAAIVLELALGAIYAWSNFAAVLKDSSGVYKWTATETQIPYAIGLASFAILVVFAGKLKAKLGSGTLIILSASFLGIGYIISGILPVSVWSLSLFYGVIGGAGIGFAYAIPIPVGAKWFPDKKGLVTGLGMAGFGAGSLIWQYLFNGVLKNTVGLQSTFWIYGIIYIIMIMYSYFFLVDPPQGYTVAGWTPEAQAKVAKAEGEEINLASREMLRTPQFYYIFFSFLIGAGIGLMIIGIAKTWPLTELEAAGVKNAEMIATFTAAVVYPIFNGIGRISWGAFADKIGWKKSLLIMNAIQAVFLFLMLIFVRIPVLLMLGMAVLAFNYGGNFSLFPLATNKTFGSKNLAENYGWVFFSFGVGGIIFPIFVGGILTDAGLQWLSFVLAGALLALSVGLTWMVKQPKKE